MPSTSGSIMSVTTASGRQVLKSSSPRVPMSAVLHLVAGMLEQDLQPLGHRRLVVDGEDALLSFQTHSSKQCSGKAQSVNTQTAMCLISYIVTESVHLTELRIC